MKIILRTVLIFALLITPYPIVAAADDTVDKTICKLAVGYQDVDEIQADLLAAAKREVINELFGEMIVASTAVENFVVTSDQIRASSIGFVRVDGNANFFNGKGFAEVCVTIHAYVTEEDKAKFNPEKLEKKYCDADDDMTTAQLIAYVKDEAIIQALVEYDPKLKGTDKESLLQLVQKVNYVESGFISDTQTYCAKFDGYVTPVEISAFLEDPGTDEITNSTSSCSEWNLSSDFRNLPDQENPYTDSCGNLKVWHLMQSTNLSRDPQSYSLLTSKTSAMFGIQGLRAWNGVHSWGGYNFPIIGVNATRVVQHPVTAMWPPNAIFVHPPPSQLAIVGWRSPINATIEITGSVRDLDGNCGDGILWFIDQENKNLASGKFNNGGTQDFLDGTGGDKLKNITVVEDDFIYFVIHPAEGFTCDSTLLDISITAAK